MPRFVLMNPMYLLALSVITLLAIAGCAASAQTVITTPPAQNFGPAPTNATLTQNLTYVTAGASSPSFTLTYGNDYSIGSAYCTGTGTITCTVSVAFQPRLPGLRQDAVLVKSSLGTTIATTLLYGVGHTSRATLLPGVISTVAGTGVWGYGGDSGLAKVATMRTPEGIAIDGWGNLFIADSINQVVRLVTKSGQITTLVGTGRPGYSGDGGPASKATLNTPVAVALDGAGNLYIADEGNNVIRKVMAGTLQISTVVGGGTPSAGSDGLGDGGPAVNAILSGPNDLAVDGAGNIYIADSFNGLIRKVSAAAGTIAVVAGGGTNAGIDGFGNGVAAISSRLNNPTSLALDSTGNLYIADSGLSMIRRVDSVSGVITAVAGNGRFGYSGDGGPALSASLSTPSSVRTDAAGNLYLADQAKNVVRQVSAFSGTISTVAGTGAARYSGDGGSPRNAGLAGPAGLAFDPAGNLFIADSLNNRVREITTSASWPISFTSTLIGLTSAPQILSVWNTGNEPLKLSAFNVPANFAQQAYGSNDCSATASVFPGFSCTIAIAFVPSSAGSLSGTLSFSTDTGNVTSFSLSGVGTAGPVPSVALTPAGLDFGNQQVGVASNSKTVLLTNNGMAPLQISALAVTGVNASDFSLTTTCQSVIAAGNNCSISVAFQAGAAGSRSAAITVFDNVANSPQSITLSGSGVAVPVASLNVAALQFGSRSIGAAAVVQQITVSNTSSSALLISAVSISGANASDYNATTTCGLSVPAGGNCAFSIGFAPHRLGLSNAAFNLTTNASASLQTVSLRGIGSVKAMPAIWRPSSGVWYLLPPDPATPKVFGWGQKGDMPAVGDYDGDGVEDFAIFRPANGTWFVYPSANSSPYSLQWGAVGDIPVPADYDGDGKTDVAVFRPSTGCWYIIPSSTGVPYVTRWGVLGDTPVAGDFDGDGKADLAIFRPSTASWFIIGSATNSSFVIQWGAAGDVPSPADYDGDGKVDIAIFRPSTGCWYIIPSSNGLPYVKQWGALGDTPVAGDFDGDGKADLAIWRPSSGSWYIIPSTGNAPYSKSWGTSGDVPVSGF